jgi:hypothetical protein
MNERTSTEYNFLANQIMISRIFVDQPQRPLITLSPSASISPLVQSYNHISMFEHFCMNSALKEIIRNQDHKNMDDKLVNILNEE